MLCVFRLCQFAAFIYGVVDTREQIRKDKEKMKFINLLTLCATLFYLAKPVYIFIASFMLPPY